jgi:lipopolysaccharide/colanic/teichoic acid biosynthesis glycosyltransferase
MIEESNYRNDFREWPKFSYARFTKRIADIIVSAVVLLLFAPFFPLIMLAVKLSSPGPVFFKDQRQGRYGKKFFCLKFRTMISGADKMQEKLRAKNQVDGPQFKMDSDPRTTLVGKFLRDTFLDEIPQFINVLFGHMSLIGPRPSPEAENSLCPAWRDARLSVRPGITGLWQVSRTRESGKDFQEWIYFDIKYVKNLSVGLDTWICMKTIKKIIVSFLSQF